MRIVCPYCQRPFAVYPLPTRQAIQHRRAGLTSFTVQMLLVLVVFGVLGPEGVGRIGGGLIELTSPRIGTGLAAGLLAWPFLFLGLAVYDRMVPHFGRPVGEPPHCLRCGHILANPREPRCPECGESV